jgi:hypothetical protein
MAQIQEPPSAYAAKYPYNNVMQTESGHFQEFDDTPGAERIRTQHKAGTFTEIHPDGTSVCKIVGNGYYITAKDDNVIINGQCNISITGNAEISVGGDAITHVNGSVKQTVEKDYSLLVKGNYSVITNGYLNITSPSTNGIYITSAGKAVFNTDVTVHGEVKSDSLHSTGSVTAGTGIHAGIPSSINPYAGISTLGGINVGIPGPTVPGVVDATVMVTAPVVIGSVVTYGGILMDPEGGAPIIRSLYDAHTHVYHPGPGAPTPTATPLPIMP